jgi:hypothetical protein
MKKIINVETNKEINFTKSDLPMMVHGREHSGASLLSITIGAMLHNAGNKLLVFTAYPMAKEEFLKQIGQSESVYELTKEDDIMIASQAQTVFVQSGNAELFINAIFHPAFVDRVVFIKNIETILIPISSESITQPFLVSGDLEANQIQKGFIGHQYRTKIFLGPLTGEQVPILEKYEAFVKSDAGSFIATLVD